MWISVHLGCTATPLITRNTEMEHAHTIQQRDKAVLLKTNVANHCSFGVCVPFFSIPVGGLCEFSLYVARDVTCVAGAFCAQYANLTAPQGLCTVAHGPSSNVPCNLTTPRCPNAFEQCKCVNFTTKCVVPEVFTPSQAKEFVTAGNCFENSPCSPADPACCKQDNCIIYDMLYAPYADILFKCGDGNPYQHCLGHSGLTTTELVLVILASIVGFSVIVGLIAFYAKRRKHHHHYDSI